MIAADICKQMGFHIMSLARISSTPSLSQILHAHTQTTASQQCNLAAFHCSNRSIINEAYGSIAGKIFRFLLLQECEFDACRRAMIMSDIEKCDMHMRISLFCRIVEKHSAAK